MSNLNLKEIQAQLQAFEDNPVAEMNRHPKKIIKQNDMALGTAFSIEDIESKRYLDAREELRNALLEVEDPSTGRVAFQPNDNAANLVDDFQFNNLQAMDDANLIKAGISENPWSDDYWAIYQGILGNRYSDPNNPFSRNWKENKDYIDSNPVAEILQSGSAARINALSPSEKYDAIIGDNSGSLTKAMWAEGQSYYDRFGAVETWMGICHGWAPASYMLARPTKTITLVTPNNVPIDFYPSDIKALATLLWANIRTQTRFIGGRCNDKNPATDPDNGRNLSDDCFDTNPGSWHMTVVNQIGVSKRSLVVDATYDYEVWNQPALSYEYTYVNLNTKRPTTNLAEAIINLDDYADDPFSRYRSNQTQQIVGISMDFDYMVETFPTAEKTDSPDKDAIHTARYLYDLEIDASGKIIGGEWRTNLHPDFIWTPAPEGRAITAFEDQATESWTQVSSPLPSKWQSAAQQASTQQSAPLAKIVEQLIAFSNSDSTTEGGANTNGITFGDKP